MAIVLNKVIANKKSNRLAAAISLILIALVLLSCTSQLHSNTQLRIGTNIWSGYEPLYLARELEYFTDREIRLVEFPSASQVMRAYRNGVIDAAALTLDEAILLLSQGYHPRIVLVMDISAGADAIIGRPQIKNMTDLMDKTIGVENSALGAFVLGRALELSGMTIDQIDVLPLNVDEHHTAFIEGRVDAVVTFEPVKTALLKQAGKVLFDSTEIPGEIVDVLVIREQFMKDHPESVNIIQQSWYRALDYFSNNTKKAATIMSPRLGLKPSEVQTSFDDLTLPTKQQSEQLLTGQQGSRPELLNTATKIYGLMLKQGVKPSTVKLQSLFPQEQPE